MGSAELQGEVWGKAPRDWAQLQEPMHHPLWEAMFTAAGLRPGARVLDAGCGGGGASLLAARRGARVSGIDAARSLVDTARERVPDGDFRVGDLEELPFEDDSFDAVVAASSLQYTQDRVAALRELKRVCAPDGRVVVGLWGAPDQVDFRTVFGAVREALPEPPPGKGPFELSGPGVLEALFEEAGLNVTGSGQVVCAFDYPSFTVFWQATAAAGPFQAALRSVPEDRLRDAVRSAVAPYAKTDGSIHMENQFRYVTATP